MSNFSEKFEQIAVTLRSLPCPLMVRPDTWWIEELLFKPGRPRTDLLIWALTSISHGSSSTLDVTNFNDSCVSSVSTSYNKVPQSSEEILDALCLVGVCTKKDLPFVQGQLSNQAQLKYWESLLDLVKFLQSPTLNTDVVFGFASFDGVVSKDNLFDVFKMNATLLPSDMKSEVERFAKKGNVNSEENTVQPKSPLLFDEARTQGLAERAARLKISADKFISMYNTEIKMCLPTKKPSGKVLTLGDGPVIITEKCSQLKKSLEIIQKIQNRSSTDVIRRKTEVLLERALKDTSFPPFKNLCEKK